MHVAIDKQDNDNGAPAPSLSQRGAARRRLTKASLGAAGGVLATLESKSAMAQMMCKSPSGSLSLGYSSHQPTNTKCNGLSASDWCDSSSWPISKDTMFCAVFYATSTGASCPTRKTSTYYKNAGTQYEAGSYYCAKFSDLLGGQRCDSSAIGKQMAAAYLNVISGKVNVITAETLQSIWNEFQSTGRFSPTAGTYWSESQIANYLATYVNI